MEFIIKQEVVNALLDYLARKPFIEVQALIAELQKVKPVEKEEPKTEE
jgi:hypothetical protein